MSFQFANPIFFLLLIFVPVLWLRYAGKQFKASVRFSSLKHVSHRNSWSIRLYRILPFLKLLAFVCLVIALARPQYGRKSVEVTSDAVDIILAIDTSGSMEALDFELEGKRQTRLTVVKKVVADFVNKRSSDRLGMVVFGENAFTQCPLTLDHGVFLSFLNELEIGAAGADATAIGSAIVTSVARLKDIPSKTKIIILLTDGRNNAGKADPSTAADLAAKYGIKIYTIGAGTKGKAPFMQKSIFGNNLVYQEVDIDDELLTSVAQKTKARYFRATDTNELNSIYDEIDKLEKTEIKVKEHVEYNERFVPFLLLAIALILADIILRNTRFRTLP